MGRCKVNWFDDVAMVGLFFLGKTNDDCRCKSWTIDALVKSDAIRIDVKVQGREKGLCNRKDQTS
jgi:hypothetical protein